MEKIFINKIYIEKVRNLKDENIYSCDDARHLILTGKNGSGKTSILNALGEYLNSVTTSNVLADYPNHVLVFKRDYDNALKGNDVDEIEKKKKTLLSTERKLEAAKNGMDVEFNVSAATVKRAFEKGEFVLAYYRDNRVLKTELAKHVEKIELKEAYGIKESPRDLFVKYLLDMKMTEALASRAGKNEKANRITDWFVQFEKVLKEIYMDDSLSLNFDEDTFEFHIVQQGKEPFGFNELSSGFAAVLDIIVDLMIRMEKHINRAFQFDIPGIVLIDEIETHLHLALQKRIMDYLTKLFPNIQFIVSTHSPFILNSLGNVIIYDLEKKITVRNGLQDVPYDGIVESYFNVDKLSEDLRDKFEKYKELTAKEKLSDDELSQIVELELYLTEIPDYLALDITTEFARLKAKFDQREDI